MQAGAEAECGSLYVATGERFVRRAERSAQSLRQVLPGVPIALASDREKPGAFDLGLRVPAGDGYRAKILAMRETPFERTLFLDADTYVVGDLACVFELLEHFDMALAHAPVHVTLPLDDVPDAYPEFNTGVIAFRRSPSVRAVLDEWLLEYDRLQPFDPPSKDQPSFRRVSFRARGLRVATLTPEFNLRFAMTGAINQRVRILHGGGDEAYYRLVARALGQAIEPGELRVLAGRKLFDGRGNQIGDFRKRKQPRRSPAS